MILKKINKVLLVDDDNVANYLNKSIFSQVNVANEVIFKTNGKDAISYLNSELKGENPPELILLDLKMPVMDGFEFLHEFEKLCRSFNHNIFVVVLTTSKDADDHLKLRQLGNFFYINKPLTSEKLLDIHHRYFRE